MEDYAKTITSERVRRVIDGFGGNEGTGGGFTYYDLGEPLMHPDGNLNESVSTDKIREYVWYMETKQTAQEQKLSEPYFLGVTADAAYYFYYVRDSVTTLNEGFLATLKTKAERYIIYADRCALHDNELQKYGIIFKKIPRDIARL
ncbi:hypothetical protein FACS1894122_12230 [Alphaproteobacteria bacterium]|nr:hypothetical protein FACS1894122_12230 [Alphaproteobacteria bacterium]